MISHSCYPMPKRHESWTSSFVYSHFSIRLFGIKTTFIYLLDGSEVDWEERELRDSDDEDGGGVGVKRKHEMSESTAKEGASIDQNESEGDIHDATDQDGESDEGGLQGMKRKLDGADLDFLPLDIGGRWLRLERAFPNMVRWILNEKQVHLLKEFKRR